MHSAVSPCFEEKLELMMARDASADGLFVTGVLTTGIYCLPSCPARKPKAENVTFFATEREAQGAGLRACKRCRPDDFYQGRDSDLENFRSALEALKADPGAFSNVAALAAQAQVGLSKLHEVALRCTETTPGELIHRARIRRAMDLLEAGEVSATEAAFAVGYGSVSAFYERFKRQTGFTPGAFARREASSGKIDRDAMADEPG